MSLLLKSTSSSTSPHHQLHRSFETRTVTARGADFEVSILHPDAPHSILCLPGALGTGSSDFAQLLASGLTSSESSNDKDKPNDNKYGIFAMTPRGLPGISRDYPLNFYRRDALDAAAVMQAILMGNDENNNNACQKKYSVLGWSDGAITAVHLAGAVAPHLVRNLVVWGGNAYVTKDDVQAFEAIRNVAQSWSNRVREEKMRSLGLSDVQELQELNDKATDGWIRHFYENDGDTCLRELHQVKCPTLVLHGAKDVICDLSHAKYMAQQIKNSQLVVLEEGKHNLHQRFADTFHRLVRDFIERNESESEKQESSSAAEGEPKVDEIV
ncbi:hypothetical protein ACA910_020913 [Epithemia clementina (nom. ined.)]